METLDTLKLLSQLVRRLRSEFRVGEWSRKPIEILRIELSAHTRQASCDWLIRPVDSWDQSMPEPARSRLQSQQVLHDALAMRRMIFRRFSELRSIELRAFRDAPGGQQELVLAGTVHRADDVPESVPSLAMRAHLSGFQFMQVDGVLSALPYEGMPYSHRA